MNLRVALGCARDFWLKRLKFGPVSISRTARSILMILLFIWGMSSRWVWCCHEMWYLLVTLFIIIIFINKKYSYKLYFWLNNIINIFSLIFHKLKKMKTWKNFQNANYRLIHLLFLMNLAWEKRKNHLFLKNLYFTECLGVSLKMLTIF